MKPPDRIPNELLEEFTMGGKIPVIYSYDDATTEEVQNSINEKFNKEELKKCFLQILRNENGYYGQTDQYLRQALQEFSVFEKHVGICGSAYPLYEAYALVHGAKKVTVIEYSNRKIDHEKIEYIKPDKVSQDLKFDIIFCISSLHHDGLGRYGDPIDPNGDIKAMQEFKKLLKPDGFLFFAESIGKDRIYFNLHRVYGRIRLPVLLEGWEIVATYGFWGNSVDVDNTGEYQPLMILRKEK